MTVSVDDLRSTLLELGDGRVRCKVCELGLAEAVDAMTAEGYQINTIRRGLLRLGVSISTSTIQRHRDGHVGQRPVA